MKNSQVKVEAQAQNLSGLHPQGVAVLVEPYEPQKEGSLIYIPPDVRDRTLMVETKAVVIEVGPAAWISEPMPRAKVGDHVLIAKYAGVIAVGTKDQKLYRLVNDRDIFCTLEV